MWMDSMMEARRAAITRAIEEEFSVKSLLNISLLRAKALHTKKLTWCLCQLEGRPYTQLRTEERADAAWNYTGMIDGCVAGDTLEFAVYSGSTDCLGRATLPHDGFAAGFQDDLPLFDAKSRKCGTLELRVEVLPVPVTARLRCFVSFVSAEGMGAPCYCACEVPGKPDSRVRTKTCDDAYWNELHELEDYNVDDQLLFSVNNGADDTTVSSVVLPSSAFHERGFEGRVPLTDGGSLDIRVDVGGPSAAPNRSLDLGEMAATIRVESLESRKKAPRRVNVETPPDDARPGTAMGDTMAAHSSMPSAMMGDSPPLESAKPPMEMGETVLEVPRAPPGEVSPEDRQPVPFQLRSLDTGRVHRLRAFTCVGRSRASLEPGKDLILTTPGNGDVSRLHAVIKAWQTADGWCARVYDHKTGQRHVYDEEGCRSLVRGGTTVDGRATNGGSLELAVGSVVRFGVNELWVLESAPLHQRLRASEAACKRADAPEDPEATRELMVPSLACESTLKRCEDWVSIVRVVLEAVGEPDEAPCADCIEVKDEAGRVVSRHLALTLDQQLSYDVSSILEDVRLGTSVRLRLSSDPLLLAPVLTHLTGVVAKVEELYKSRATVLE